jgi:hypothetical protein
MKSAISWKSAFAVGIACLPLFACWYGLVGPRRSFERLVAGDPHVDIRSVQISGQRRSMTIDDPAALHYLSAAFRSATCEGYVPMNRPGGTSYVVNLDFGMSGSMDLYARIPVDLSVVLLGARSVSAMASPNGQGAVVLIPGLLHAQEVDEDGFLAGYDKDLLGDPIYYWVSLKPPVPEVMARALRKLRE